MTGHDPRHEALIDLILAAGELAYGAPDGTSTWIERDDVCESMHIIVDFPLGTLLPREQAVEVIVATEDDVRHALRDLYAGAGMTLTELRVCARTDRWPNERARQAWWVMSTFDDGELLEEIAEEASCGR